LAYASHSAKNGADTRARPRGRKPLKLGPQTLPGSVGIGVLGTGGVRVSGFRVTGAGFDAILVGASWHVLVSGNYLWGNGDVGVDVDGSSYTQALRNTSTRNEGGRLDRQECRELRRARHPHRPASWPPRPRHEPLLT
jgi:hypothetical protein